MAPSQPIQLLTLFIVIAWQVSSARCDETDFFREYIEPLLKTNCYDCHSHEAGEASGGLVLDSKAGWSVGGDSGPTIVPGALDKSLLWQVVNYKRPGLEMPPDGKLADSDLALIQKWIESGAMDPREDGRAAERKQIDLEVGRQWWAFQPIMASSVADQRPQAVSRIDWFIGQRLQAAGLKSEVQADRQTLLRRVSYDLTGLPPNPKWVASTERLDEHAYASYVDSLLASTAFGEKWGRHWLDIARYADSNGSSFNVPFHNAWRYRNWVIDAFNRNMPIDEFIRKQIAGDLLPFESDAERDENFIATGYLLLGSKVLGTFDKEQLTLDVIDEQVDTIGKSLLGMTLGCARCHDHKFDPLPQADYYALAGILASTSTLVDRIGGPKDDESDWERRGLGPAGDERLQAFLKEHRYDWVKAVAKRFEAKKELDNQRAKQQSHEDDADQVEALRAAEAKLQAAEDSLQSLLADMPPHAMAVRESAVVRDLEIRIRGVAASKGDLVPRGFLQVASFPEQPTVPQSQSGRLELAEWITSPRNPLTARVFVNRVWKHLFREGLVRSVDNFGTTGEEPSHPELLDDLAARFIASGWDLKQLVREMVLSETYRRAVSTADPKDPENRLLAQQNRRRLEAEEIRDTLLMLSESLEDGPNEYVLESLPIGDASNLGEYLNIRDNRRTVYQPVIRTLEPHVLQLFDAASNTMVTGARPRTVVAPQSLYFLNSEFV
ncbi:MAG: PSD1 and planctomycete cytochrome C domain-containing protein, partial [bacterium]|nr:PSD1 and planctomycete cytochrome C domain-containing protein [bacterium]